MSKVYDPRVSKVVESNNPALIARDFIHGTKPQPAEVEERWTGLANYCEEMVYLCSQEGCTEPALDQRPYQQPSVCRRHDPGR